MKTFKANDNATLAYSEHGSPNSSPLILLHGFTGSSQVWKRNIPALAEKYHVFAPDLRGHGESDKTKHGFHVSRLAMDLKELLDFLGLSSGGRDVRVIGGSLGCSILWCYAELFTTAPFSHMIFVDQSPLQNSTLDGWDSRFCNRGMNTSAAVAALQATLSLSPETAHKGTISGCLSYRSHPQSGDKIQTGSAEAQEDEAFFLGEAMKGNSEWYGRLMADHTSLDWRYSIPANFGPGSKSKTKVLVVASSRSGCFPSAGPMAVVELINQGAKSSQDEKAAGFVVEWGGHWCYWEDPEKFDKLVLSFLGGENTSLL
ncbi:alpha hydrolase-7 [Coleophoma crateriformis]|uniref:Alpha hydrolase-7 n=1 Tax=Coleophoma crateriformis TaxID=565419 RepID=A0A3D8QUJ5_9HELO|nr:alpha hydrolase-7 [Coleophoma crateriformis]